MHRSGLRRLTAMSILAAAALILFVVEAQIPPLVAIPGIKLGLANVVTLFTIYYLGRKEAAAVLLVRVLLGGIFTGQALALLYSASGAVLCWAAMSLLSGAFPEKQMWAVSVVGAIAHNLGQLAAAMLVMRTASVLWYAPALMIAAVLSGTFTGIAAQITLAALKRNIREN